MGVTGARSELPPELVERVSAIKALTDKPVSVGFGVTRPDQARAIAAVSDGVIVGSALINLITDNLGSPDLKEKVAEYAHSLSEVAHGIGENRD
jgi:tryptophan synthase alpha chain